MGRRELARRRRRRGRFGEDGKKRRSLNLADPLREKLMRLFKVRRNSMLEVDDADGAVRTTTNDSSVNCKLFGDALLYECSIFVGYLRSWIGLYVHLESIEKKIHTNGHGNKMVIKDKYIEKQP